MNEVLGLFFSVRLNGCGVNHLYPQKEHGDSGPKN